MHAVLIPIGSSGDVHPFIGIGRALAKRGHRVTVVTNSHFASLIERSGLAFIESGTDEEYREAIENPDIWHPRRGFGAVMSWLLPRLRSAYDRVAELVAPGDTVVLASPLALAARIAQEKFNFPLVTVHLQPCVFRSVHRPPVLPGVWTPAWMPNWYTRGVYRMLDLLIDRVMGPSVNGLRLEVGLAPERRFLDKWWHAPQRVIGMFPEWYAPRQPDWPEQVRHTGFPLWDQSDTDEVSGEVTAYLDAGPPPVVITPGSANVHARAFFDAALGACAELGRRAMLITSHRGNLPAELPGDVRHFSYVPFSRVFSRAAAVIHHGGIGTCAQALAAGTPQLVMPMSHDQPDNAARLEHLKVGIGLSPRQFTRQRVTVALRRLLESLEVRAHCTHIEEQMKGADPLLETCRLIEDMADQTL